MHYSSFNPLISRRRFYYDPILEGKKPRHGEAEWHAQVIQPESHGGGTGTQMVGCRACHLVAKQKIRISDRHPEAYTPWLSLSNSGTQGCPLHSLSAQTFLLKTVSGLWSTPSYIPTHHFYFSLHDPHPPLCKDFLITLRHSALPFKRSPLFLESGHGVHTPHPQGFLVCLFLGLCCFWSRRNENVINGGNSTLVLYFHECETWLPHWWGHDTYRTLLCFGNKVLLSLVLYI